MKNEKQNDFFEWESHGQSPGRVGSALLRVSDQIEIECFDASDREYVKWVSLLIAEVYALPDTCSITIEGDKVPAENVKEIYSRLDHEMIADVISRLKNISYQVKGAKTYIRTALYNEVLEHEFNLMNFAMRATQRAPRGRVGDLSRYTMEQICSEKK